jgi:small redox-active disulfide protein 2
MLKERNAMMNIKILGTGCARCDELAELTKKAVREMGIDAIVEKVQDLEKIIGYGVMMTPGLVIDEQVKVAGRMPTLEQIKQWITES